MRFLLAILLSISANAATYYVATNGSNANPGTSGSPWLTIQYSITNAAAGDTVNVGPGVYTEFLGMRFSGTAGNPITFQGTRDVDGSWLTIIDTSTPLTNGWTVATEIGGGCYKATAPFVTHELSINYKRVGYVYTTNSMASAIANTFIDSSITTGSQVLALPSSYVCTNGSGAHTQLFWDGIEALWSSSSTTTFLRLRDGSDPNGLNIRVAENSGDLLNTTMNNPILGISSKNYITWRNFHMRGAIGLIKIFGTSHDCLVESNLFTAAAQRITMNDSVSSNTFRFNSFTTDFYGGPCNGGSWSGLTDSSTLTNAWIRRHQHALSKYLMGNGTDKDNSIYLLTGSAALSNNITGNILTNGLGNAVNLAGSFAAPASGNTVSSNYIANWPSVAILLDNGVTKSYVYDNTLVDCNSEIRLNNFDVSGETDRSAYIYRNKTYETNYLGDQIDFLFLDSGSTFHPTIWFYHNSFSGHRDGFTTGHYTANVSLQNVAFVNNIWSLTNYLDPNATAPFTTTSTKVGAFDYNWVITQSNPAWYGSSNKTGSTPIWTGVPSFSLSAGSSAIDNAVDTTGTFSAQQNIVGQSALPQDSTVKVGPAWDIGALEFTPTIVVTCPTVNGVNGVAITPVTVTSAGGYSPYTYIASGLPTGLSCASNGTISGTPTASGAFSYSAIATDAYGITGSGNGSGNIINPAGGATAVNAIVTHLSGQ